MLFYHVIPCVGLLNYNSVIGFFTLQEAVLHFTIGRPFQSVQETNYTTFVFVCAFSFFFLCAGVRACLNCVSGCD